MSDTTHKITDPLLPEEIPESAQDPDFDLILEHWKSIAALSWCGWLVWGLGAVVLVVTPQTLELRYEPGITMPVPPDSSQRPTTPASRSWW